MRKVRKARRGTGLMPPIVAAIIVFVSSARSPAIESEMEASIARGHALLKERCSTCHAVAATGESPFQPAPPFRSLHEKYDVSDLEEALAEGIVSGHPAMPEFTFEPRQIDDIVAYLRTLQ
jgi:cytochrome c